MEARPEEVARRIGLSDAAIERVKRGEVVVEELVAEMERPQQAIAKN